MGRQINFFMMPADAAELEKYIKELGLLMVSDRNSVSTPLVLGNLINKESLKTYIIVPQNLSSLTTKYYESFNKYIVNEMECPVIEFIKPVYVARENKMNKGRLYYDKTLLTKDGKIEYKDDMTTTAAEKLFKWLKKNLPDAKVNANYTTYKAAEWAKQNNVYLPLN